MARPVLLLTGRHRPHELLLLAYSTLLGVGYLAQRGAAPASVAAVLPGPALMLWAAGLAVSGVVGLVGCWMHGERGMGFELGGLLINTGVLLIYVAAVFAAAGLRAVFAGGVVAAWAVANLWRAAQIDRDLRKLRGHE